MDKFLIFELLNDIKLKHEEKVKIAKEEAMKKRDKNDIYELV